MSVPSGLTVDTLESDTRPQRICGWCRLELSPGCQPATHGICPLCNVRLTLDAQRHRDTRQKEPR